MNELLKKYKTSIDFYKKYNYFFYTILSDNYKLLYHDFYDCLGYIGDFIHYNHYKTSEYDRFQNTELLNTSETFIIAVTQQSRKQSIINYLRLISQNWNLNMTVKYRKNLLLIEIPKDVFIKTKWKVQGMMQLFRLVHNNDHKILVKRGIITINGCDYDNYESKAFEANLANLYTLSFMPLDDSLLLMDKTSCSHLRGVMYYAAVIFKHYKTNHVS